MRVERMCGHIQRGAFADLRLGRRTENHINFEVLKPMGKLRDQKEGTAGFVVCNRRMVINRKLTIQVLGKHRMDRAAVNMTRISMTMVCLGMHVEEWNHEHPEGCPHQDQYPRTRCLVAYLSHENVP